MLYVNDLTIRAGDFRVNGATIHVQEGEYFFLLGGSGSGKSLILEAIAGIRSADSGTIMIDGHDISHEPMHRRHAGMVFQSLALFPHKTVFENIAFPLKVRKTALQETKAAVEEIAERLLITGLLERRPGTLSGGEHQRVALARTLVMKPKVLLLDEPLSSLDVLLREEMLTLLGDLHRAGQTILHVTHDYHVVNKLADRIAIIEGGRILQNGTIKEIKQNPVCELARKLKV